MIALSVAQIAEITGAIPRGELLQVPDAAAALAAVSERVRPGDMVLVKASRSASLERVALALTGEVPL